MRLILLFFICLMVFWQSAWTQSPEPLPAGEPFSVATEADAETSVVTPTPIATPVTSPTTTPIAEQPTPTLPADQLFPVDPPPKPKKQPVKPLPPLNEMIVAATNIRQAEELRRELADRGIPIANRKRLLGLGMVLSTFRLADDIDMEALMSELRLAFPKVTVERNQRYRLMQAPSGHKKSYARQRLGLSYPSSCRQPVVLAMFDTRVNDALPMFDGSRLVIHEFAGSSKNSEVIDNHGTAVASLLIAQSEPFSGLLPAATLHAFNVFKPNERNQPESRTTWLLAALNELTQLDPLPAAVNFGFGGEQSVLLEKAFNRLSKKMVLVAAAGNSGGGGNNGGDANKDGRIYPAAYASVIAVGAVDSRGKKMPRSGEGEYIRLWAPGQGVWTSNSNGIGYHASGTSFATPFATAALALVTAQGQSVEEYLQALGTGALVNFQGLCDH